MDKLGLKCTLPFCSLYELAIAINTYQQYQMLLKNKVLKIDFCLRKLYLWTYLFYAKELIILKIRWKIFFGVWNTLKRQNIHAT